LYLRAGFVTKYENKKLLWGSKSE